MSGDIFGCHDLTRVGGGLEVPSACSRYRSDAAKHSKLPRTAPKQGTIPPKTSKTLSLRRPDLLLSSERNFQFFPFFFRFVVDILASKGNKTMSTWKHLSRGWSGQSGPSRGQGSVTVLVLHSDLS